MLEGIRGLAEGRAISPTRDALTLASWFGAFVAFIAAGAAVLGGRGLWRPLAAFGASGGVCQVVTLAQPSPLLSLGLVVGLALLLRPSASAAARDATRVLESAA